MRTPPPPQLGFSPGRLWQGRGGADLTDASMKNYGTLGHRRRRGRSRPGISPSLDPHHQLQPQPGDRLDTQARPKSGGKGAHRAWAEEQQTDLAPPAARAATPRLQSTLGLPSERSSHQYHACPIAHRRASGASSEGPPPQIQGATLTRFRRNEQLARSRPLQPPHQAPLRGPTPKRSPPCTPMPSSRSGRSKKRERPTGRDSSQ